MQRKRATPRSLSSATASATSSLGGLGPARERDLAAAGVDGDDDALAVRRHARASRNSGSRSAAVPITTRSAPAASTAATDVGVAQAAADLDRALDRGGDPPHRVEVPRLPRLRPVEVDHVEELGPFAGPARRRVDRVGVVGGLALVVALQQPHRLAAADVDRRVEDHAARTAWRRSPAKLESSRSPAALDFSGWNWTPKTLSRSAAQAKRAP